MATNTHIIVTDDITGEPDAATVTFGLDGVTYAVDLGPANRARLREALEPFVAVAKRVPKSGAGNVVKLAGQHDVLVAQLRIGAAQHTDHNLSARGRVPTAVVLEYEKWLAGTWTPPAKTHKRRTKP